MLAIEHFGLSAHELKNIIIYGFKRSFFPGSYTAKRDYVRQVIDYYERVTAAAAETADAAGRTG